MLLLLVAAALLLGLPLLGVRLAGAPLERYGEFPPRSLYLIPAPFSWWAAGLFLLLEIPLFVPVIALLRRLQVLRPAAPLPGWAWLALAWIAAWWGIAWTRLPVLAGIQAHTYTPLWLGYIALVNGLTYARTGRCMLTHEPRRLAGLFAASAAFWWFFEYLNRFVQNWYYLGVADFSPLRYFLFATPAFATVLPAVLGTAALLETFLPAPALTRCPVRLPPATRGGAWALLLVAGGGLAGIGVWPDYLFPLLWLAPLFLLTALRSLGGIPSILAPATGGDWRRIAVLMTAALVCGFFWELWNFHSLAKWIYQVPFVGAWKVFEMPVLGFAGYLPFGLECAVIADLLGRRRI